MNDALRTDVFVRYTPETIACACIWLAGRQLKLPLPENPPWYQVFRITLADIEEIAASVLKLYIRKKVKLDVLEARVEEIRREQQEARLRNKVVSALATPKDVTTFSPANNTPGKGGGSPHRKRSSSERRKHSGSSNDSHSRSKSRSPNRHPRKKTKRSHSGSRSHTRSRSSHSRDRYHSKKKYSRTPSPTVTPPPRFIKNKEKGPIVRSVSRSRTRSPHRTYDKYDKYEKISSIKSIDRYDRFDKSEKYAREDRRYDHKDKIAKYNMKYMDKQEKKKVLREAKREVKKYYYDNGYEKHHKSKKTERQRSRSRDRENRRR